MSIFKSSIVQFAIAATGLSVLWLGLTKVNANLSLLPVHQVTQVTAEAAAAGMPQIFPVWVTPRVRTLDDAQAVGTIDDAFQQKRVEPEDEQLPVPNYAETLKPSVQVQGVSANGAFINGRYHQVGAALDSLQFAAIDGHQVVPTLFGVNDNQVVIAVAGDRLVLRRGSEGWH